MDTQGDSMNLGEEDIVKSTQFFSQDVSGSQIHSNAEARVGYGSSQSASIYQTPHVPYAAMRPVGSTISQGSMYPSMSQIPCSQLNAWPTYNGGSGPHMHPMMHMFGSGFYPPFPTASFNGMVPTYGGPSLIGLNSNFVQSQTSHPGGPHSTVEWSNTQKENPPVKELPRPSSTEDGDQNRELRPHSTRQSVSSGGQWICPRSKVREKARPAPISFGDVQAVAVNPPERSPMKKVNEDDVPWPTTGRRRSPPPSSADTLQGPLPSCSDVADHNAEAVNDRETEGPSTTLSADRVRMEGSNLNPSKSTIPYSLSQRRALREDDRSYLKEVKLAISEGRVPQVTVIQDDSGNIIRYKSQFMNALKLASQAVVQGAYIDVNDEGTLKEIMDEVRRQFKLRLPLPPGLVENYLKGYFKRCRLEYRQYWIEHRGKKKPEGCKQVAWLELVEYWKSPEGSKESEQNKKNVSAEKPKKRRNLKFEVHSSQSVENVTPVQGTRSIDDLSGYSEPLAFNSGTPLMTTPASPTTGRNPMTDISNQLHDAVDNILSYYAKNCHELPSSKMKSVDLNSNLQAPGGSSFRSTRKGFRTAAQVLGSLQRPEVKIKNELQSSALPNAAGESYMFVNSKWKEPEQPACNFSSNKLSTEQEMVLLSTDGSSDAASDGSSDGAVVTGIKRGSTSRTEERKEKAELEYTEEIGGWRRMSMESGSAVQQKGKTPVSLNVVPMKGKPPLVPYMALSKQKLFVEEETATNHLRQREVLRGMSSKAMGQSSTEENEMRNEDVEREPEKEDKDQNARNVEFGGSSEDEEPPVLPREVIKRTPIIDSIGSAGREVNDNSRKKRNPVAAKKLKGTQIDESFLKKLQFFKRSKNSHPIKTRTPVWVLHPDFPGKIVAEATAGVNRKSRCVDSANELCKEGQQMIHVLRVIFKNTTVMYDKGCRFPQQISYLDQAEGLPNTPVLWCVCHLLEVPPFHQITKLLGAIEQPLSQEVVSSDPEFETGRKKQKGNFFGKETKGGRKVNSSNARGQGSKMLKTSLRSGKK